MPVLSTIGAMAARGFGWLYKAIGGPSYSAWSWGANLSGQLGLNDTTARSSPVQIGSASDISFITTGGGSSAYIKTNGTLWMWGSGGSGVLGQGNLTDYSSPVQVGTDTTWAWVAVSALSHTRAIKTDGTLWGWGANNFGQLGLGDTVARSSPVQVGTLTNWSKAAGGNQFSLLLKTDGTIWSTGINSSGQLGLGDTTNRSSPVQIGTGTNWASIGAEAGGGLAITTSGTLWSWGANTSGGLGLGDTTNRSSPVQVGALTTWATVQNNGDRQCCAVIRTDGTLWLWGINSFGALGQGNTTDYSSPVQLGTATNWKYAQASLHTAAATTSGQLWTWGYNSDGQLGSGTTTNRSSPVQVGASTNWVTAYAMGTSSFALRN